MPKVKHEFPEQVTANKFRAAIGGEWLDAPRVPHGTKIFIRKNGVGCWQ